MFDYEEDSPEKLFLSEFKAKGNFSLKRMPRDEVQADNFTNFNLMRLEQQYLNDLRQEKDKLIPQNSSRNYFLSKLLNEKYGQVAATVMNLNSNYWIYHKNTIEYHEDEKANPGEKLWLLIRHMQADKEHKFIPKEGYEI